MTDTINLMNRDAIEKMRKLAKGNITMLCTFPNNEPTPRPMDTQQIDEDGTLWFFTKRDTAKVRHILANSKVQLIYPSLSVTGTARVTRDQKKIDEMWDMMSKTWFSEGKEDPELMLIEVKPAYGYYWDTKHNKMIALAGMLAGAVTGAELDDSVEGRLTIS